MLNEYKLGEKKVYVEKNPKYYLYFDELDVDKKYLFKDILNTHTGEYVLGFSNKFEEGKLQKTFTMKEIAELPEWCNYPIHEMEKQMNTFDYNPTLQLIYYTCSRCGNYTSYGLEFYEHDGNGSTTSNTSQGKKVFICEKCLGIRKQGLNR